MCIYVRLLVSVWLVVCFAELCVLFMIVAVVETEEAQIAVPVCIYTCVFWLVLSCVLCFRTCMCICVCVLINLLLNAVLRLVLCFVYEYDSR